MPERYAKLGVVVAAFAGPTYEPSKEVLLIKRAKEPFAGSWALPGGGVEHGERVLTAAARELREETGIDMPDAMFRVRGHREFIDGPWHRYHVLLRVDTLSYTAKAGDDALEARWWNTLDALHSSEVTSYAKACLNDILEVVG